MQVLDVHPDGKMPVLIDRWQILVRDGATMSAATFRSLRGILSNPVAFLTFSFLRRLRTSPTVGILSENV